MHENITYVLFHLEINMAMFIVKGKIVLWYSDILTCMGIMSRYCDVYSRIGWIKEI
jgi:hypothetical protein